METMSSNSLSHHIIFPGMLIRDLGVHKALPLTIPHKGGRVTPKEPGKEAAAL